MYAIMGITGKVGGAVAETLLNRGEKIVGVVRDAAKGDAWKKKGVEIRVSNYDNNLAYAFRGVERGFVMI